MLTLQVVTAAVCDYAPVINTVQPRKAALTEMGLWPYGVARASVSVLLQWGTDRMEASLLP
jgi:hypothetical protein